VPWQAIISSIPVFTIYACNAFNGPLTGTCTGRFDMERAQQAAGWLAALKKGYAPAPQHGINSWVYRSRRLVGGFQVRMYT